MATFSETDKKGTIETKTKEAFYKNVSAFMNHTNNSTMNELDSKKVKNVTLVKRGGVPDSHRAAADGLMIIKKIFGNPVIQCRLTKEEKEVLAKYDFNPLEYSTSKQIEEELALLKKWGNARDLDLQEASDIIIHIRAKELKNIIATRYVTISSGIYNGYSIMEKYLESVSKYNIER
jgi:hypothetical protein